VVLDSSLWQQLQRARASSSNNTSSSPGQQMHKALASSSNNSSSLGQQMHKALARRSHSSSSLGQQMHKALASRSHSSSSLCSTSSSGAQHVGSCPGKSSCGVVAHSSSCLASMASWASVKGQQWLLWWQPYASSSSSSCCCHQCQLPCRISTA
jgi:hypothetical protein